MSASERLQEDKDRAFTSTKKTLEKDGKILPAQAEANITNNVDNIEQVISSSISNISNALGNITSFANSLSNSLNQSLNSIAASLTSSLTQAVDQLTQQFQSSLDSIVNDLEQTKNEELENREDKQAAKVDPFQDDYGVTTYTSFDNLVNDISDKKYSDGTVLKLEGTRAYYVVVRKDTKFTHITLFNHNLNRMRNGLAPVQPKGSVSTKKVSGVNIYEGQIKN